MELSARLTQVSSLSSPNTGTKTQNMTSLKVLATQEAFFFGRSVLNYNYRCLFSEKVHKEGIYQCLPELYPPLSSPFIKHLLC